MQLLSVFYTQFYAVGGEKKVVFLLHDIVLCEKTFIVIERPCEKTIGLQRKIIIYKMYYV